VLLAVAIVASINAVLPSTSAAALRCIDASAMEARAHSAGSDAGPPNFTAAFIKLPFSIDVSTDGVTDNTLPVSVEAVCGTRKAYDKQAGQLVGGSGVVVMSAQTSVWKNGKMVGGADRVTELEGSDTARVRVRLLPASKWLPDGDGNNVPTFSATRIVITD
jgi:hypothetical protein